VRICVCVVCRDECGCTCAGVEYIAVFGRDVIFMHRNV
jgi:hypothetical protein